jgi:hypothetical protein
MRAQLGRPAGRRTSRSESFEANQVRFRFGECAQLDQRDRQGKLVTFLAGIDMGLERTDLDVGRLLHEHAVDDGERLRVTAGVVQVMGKGGAGRTTGSLLATSMAIVSTAVTPARTKSRRSR